jgi:phosphate-selective porin
MAAALFAPYPVQASEMDRLLDLLVKKHVLSEEEAATFREEAKKEQDSEMNLEVAEKPHEEVAKVSASERAQAVVEKQNQEPEKKEHPVAASSRVKLSGWAQTRFTNGTGLTNDTVELRRARLAVDGNLAPRVAYKMEIDAVRSPVLLDARLDYSWRPFAKVTVGQFKIPFSQENLDSDRDTTFVERSLVGLSLVPGRDTGNNGRDDGAQLGGSVARSDGRPILDYAVGIFNGAGIDRRDDNRRKDGVGRLVVHPFAGLSLAGDYYNGATGATNVSRERADVEFAYTRKLYSLRGEYIWGHDGPVRKYGWYSQFAYRFQPKWEALARFDTFDPQRHAGGDVTKTYLVGVNWYLSKWVKLQANYGLVDEEARAELTNLILSQVQFQF